MSVGYRYRQVIHVLPTTMVSLKGHKPHSRVTQGSVCKQEVKGFNDLVTVTAGVHGEELPVLLQSEGETGCPLVTVIGKSSMYTGLHIQGLCARGQASIPPRSKETMSLRLIYVGSNTRINTYIHTEYPLLQLPL
jgi:hypothetical protein